MEPRKRSEEIITFNVVERAYYYTIEFELITGVIEPAELKVVRVPLITDGGKGVILSGRGPIWLYGMMIHQFHPTAWVATMDKRTGPVVVESHIRGIRTGDIIDHNLTDPEFWSAVFAQGRN